MSVLALASGSHHEVYTEVMQSSSPQRNRPRPASLRGSRGARTVLLRMAADQERADRIRALKQERPDLTWRRIADHVGVTERSATDWQKKGGIDYANAVKLASLFEVDVDYIWRGTESETPDPFEEPLASGSQLAELTARIASLEGRLEEIGEERRHQQEAIVTRLDQLVGLLTEADDDALVAAAQVLRESLAPPSPPARPARPSRKRPGRAPA